MDPVMAQQDNESAAQSPTVPLPPANAKVVTTACDYCIVGCGYKAYVWPEGEEGGAAADENDPYFGLRLQARWRSARRQ